MPPTVILIRHGEALHNASQNYEIHDPCLSELGVQQCKKLETQLREHCKVANDVDVIITSPMIRTIETTLLGLDWLIRCGVPLETDALWQGVSFSVSLPNISEDEGCSLMAALNAIFVVCLTIVLDRQVIATLYAASLCPFERSNPTLQPFPPRAPESIIELTLPQKTLPSPATRGRLRRSSHRCFQAST